MSRFNWILLIVYQFMVLASSIFVESYHADYKLSPSLRQQDWRTGGTPDVSFLKRSSSRTDTCPTPQTPDKHVDFMRSSALNDTIIIGFLTPYNQNQFSLGAIRLAVDNINNSTLLPGKKLCYIAEDIGSYNLNMTSRPIKLMTAMRDKGAIAFIGGPEDTCAIEALVAAAWNLPMISYKCSDYQVSNKATYTTFARTLPPSSKVTKSVVSLLKTFNWNKVAVVMCHRTRDRWYPILEAFKILAKDNKINITGEYSITNYLTEKFPQMESIVEKSYRTTRVYVFIGEHLGLIDLVRALDGKKLLDSGDYIIISVDDQIWDTKNSVNLFESWIDRILNGTSPKPSPHGFKSVLKLTLSYPKEANYSEILRNFANLSTKPPFEVPFHDAIFSDPTIELPIEGAYLYDAVMVYAKALNRTLEANIDVRNGAAVFEKIRNKPYRSIQGFDMFIDANGDAEGNYTVIAYIDDVDVNGTVRRVIVPVGDFKQVSSGSSQGGDIPEFRYFNESRPIQWVGGKPPLAEPECGFQGEKCVYQPEWTKVAGLILVACLALVAMIFAARHYRYEQKLACLLWKIDMKDVVSIPLGPAECTGGTQISVALCRQLVCSAVESDAPLEFCCKKAYTRIGFYKGMVVAIKPIYKRNIDLSRNIRKELIQIRELRHENIIPFIGASVETGNICILTAYCARGSLEDVLRNEDLHLDNIFLASLVADLIRGMIYIHDSEIISHGNLKSSNCLVDSRWVLQISDFGLHEFKAGQEVKYDEQEECQKLLWRAPELIRAGANAPLRGTQKGDVYSFGIILYELIGRQGPWGKTSMSIPEIIERLTSPDLNGGKILRPPSENLDCGDAILKCLHICWDEEPEQRPDFRFIRVRLKEMQSGLKPNIFDNMLSIMEKYASNLEDLVQERTNQLTEEKKKTDALLHRMLPKSVAESLKRGEPVEAESFDSVTIYFSDIVGFTALSAVSTPMQVVELLNDLYTCFDSIISNYDVYKVETIGDAYMVVSGLPIRNGSKHAGEIASMALHLLERIRSFEIRHRPSERLKLRIGIHSGPVVAGVVGLKMPRYCLFGDTVNTASRMESTGEALRIHISYVTKDLLTTLAGYRFQERGIISIKGKGDMRTYWLTGEDNPERGCRREEQSQERHSITLGQHTSDPYYTTTLSNSSSRTFVHSSGGITKTLSINSNRRNDFLKYEINNESRQSKFIDKATNKPHTWLLDEAIIRSNLQGNVTYKAGRHRSCSSILQDCKASIIKELKRNGSICTTTVSDTDRFRSAPIITFIETPTSAISVNATSHLHTDEPRFV